MKHNKLKEGVLTDFKAGLLKGDLYKKEPLFNATALYYTLIADLLQGCSLQYLNWNVEGFLIAIEELLDNSIPILKHNKHIKIEDHIEKLRVLRIRLGNIQVIRTQADEEKGFIMAELKIIRRTLLSYLAPVLMATRMSLNPEEKLRDAFS